uniref:Kinetochore protein Nuf2 N-terminal domain-containing protein n=2 Tax=Timema TaxID=61471 RepID=A0A7R9JY30_TIMGE|nr:unnamed protein product [Timema genevievae]
MNFDIGQTRCFEFDAKTIQNTLLFPTSRKTMENKLKTEQDLLSAIQEKIPDFKISLSDLKNPSREFVFRYYTMVLGEFGADVNSMVLPHPVQKKKFPHIPPETLRLTNIFKLLKAFFARIGEEFSLDDLTDPHPKRTLYLISHLDNFHTFADMRAASINEVKRNVFDRTAKRDQIMNTKDNIEEKINQECIDKANRQTTKQQLSSQNEMFEDTMGQLIKKKCEIVHIMDSLKSMESIFMEQNEKLTEKENKLERRIEMMKLQIVPSPEMLQENLTQLKAQLQVSKDEVAASKEAQEGKFQLLKKLQLCVEQQSARDNLLSSIVNLHHEQSNINYNIIGPVLNVPYSGFTAQGNYHLNATVTSLPPTKRHGYMCTTSQTAQSQVYRLSWTESMDLIKSLMEEKHSDAEEVVNLTQKLCQLKQEIVQIKDEISHVQASGKQNVETNKQQMEQLNRDHQAIVEKKEKNIESISKLEQKIAQTKLKVEEETTVFKSRAQFYTERYDVYKAKMVQM